MSQVQIETNISRIVPASSLLDEHGLQHSYSQIAGNNHPYSSGQHRINTPHDHTTGLPADPFNDVGGMYLPETAINNANNASIQQQDDIFDDIVANTNPDFISVIPSRDQVAMASLYNTQVDGFLSVKRHLMEQRSSAHNRSSSSDRLYTGRRNLHLNDAQDMPLSDKEGFVECDFQNISDYGNDENTAMILDMAGDRNRIHAYQANAQRNARAGPFGADLFNDAHSDYNPFENHQLEYENCAENRSATCGNEEDDNVSASTQLTFSVTGGEFVRGRTNSNVLTPQKQDRAGNVSPAKGRTTKSQIYSKEEQEEDFKEFEMLDFDKQIETLTMQRHGSHVQTIPHTFEFGKGRAMDPAVKILKDDANRSFLPQFDLRDKECPVPKDFCKQSPEAAIAYQFAQHTEKDIAINERSAQNFKSSLLKNFAVQGHKQTSVFETVDTCRKSDAINAPVQITDQKITNIKLEPTPAAKDNLKPRKQAIKKTKNSPVTTKAAKPRGMGTKRLNQKLFRARATINFRMNKDAKDGDGLKFYPLAEVSEETATKICNKTQKNKYYQNFDFFFKRSCFRVMTEFYKDRFNTFFTERVAQLKISDQESFQTLTKAGGLMSLTRSEMDELVTEFLKWTFGTDLGAIQDKSLQLHSIMILFSHRYTKNDLFLLEEPIEFDIIRDVMYKYSKKAQDKYFAYPVECFMFAAFALSTEGQMYLRNKPDNVKDTEKLAKMLKDLGQLKTLAVQSLQQFANPIAQMGDAAQTQTLDPNIILGTQLLSHLLKLTKGQL